MNRQLLNIIWGSLLLLACQNSKVIDTIHSEYEFLKSDYSGVENKSIKVLEEYELTFEELGNREFHENELKMLEIEALVTSDSV